LLVNLDSGQVYAPYDGGADLFYSTEFARDNARERFAAWLQSLSIVRASTHAPLSLLGGATKLANVGEVTDGRECACHGAGGRSRSAAAGDPAPAEPRQGRTQRARFAEVAERAAPTVALAHGAKGARSGTRSATCRAEEIFCPYQ
jgi:hypothetical protein